MTQFSANLGFLWRDRPLVDAIFAAKAAGFDAVEMHWPYDVPAAQVKSALLETGLPLLGINTQRGDVEGGQNGLSALPDQSEDARAAIDQALALRWFIGFRPKEERTVIPHVLKKVTRILRENFHVLGGNVVGNGDHLFGAVDHNHLTALAPGDTGNIGGTAR